MYLKSDILEVKIGRVTIGSSKHLLPAFVLDEEAVTGWTDGVDIRRDITPRALAWGDFPERSYKSSRTITITGTAISTSPQELHYMRDVLAGLFQKGVAEEIAVTNASGTRYAYVSLASAPAWLQKSDTIAVWKLDLYADDPRIYGPAKTPRITDSSIIGGLKYPITYPVNYGAGIFSQSNTITNNGNAPAFPVFTAVGEFYGGFTIDDGRGNSVVYTGVVTPQAPVSIDMMKQTATQSGFDRSTQLQSRNFFSVAPGETIAPKFTPLVSGSGWCDIMYRDTWI